jgi:RNA polymerase sigma factor (TIGR02999 family)
MQRTRNLVGSRCTDNPETNPSKSISEFLGMFYLRLAREEVDWQNREHFIGVAAHVMRRVLVDYARAHKAEMRGGGLKRVELEEGLAISVERSEDVLALDEALSRLTELNPRQARVVELRYFGGLSVEQIASVLSIAPRSVKRDWALARIWLFKELRVNADQGEDRRD